MIHLKQPPNSFPLHNRSSQVKLLSIIMWIRSPQSFCTISNLSMTIFKRIPTRLVLNRFQKLQQGFINNRSPSTIFNLLLLELFPLFPWLGLLITSWKQSFFNQKRLMNFLSNVGGFITRFLTVLWAYVVCHRCWFCCLRVSKANLFWLLKSTIIAYICTPVSSCWLNTKRNQKFVKEVPPSTWCIRKSIDGTSVQTNQVRRQTNVSRQLNMDNASV